jgi:hypothetical protein
VSLRGRLRNLEREAAVSLVVVEHGDSKTSRFREDEVFPDCFLQEMERGARHFAGEHPGEAHPFVVALRSATNLDALMRREQGTMVGHFLGEDEIIRGVRERPGPAVREISSGVYE